MISSNGTFWSTSWTALVIQPLSVVETESFKFCSHSSAPSNSETWNFFRVELDQQGLLMDWIHLIVKLQRFTVGWRDSGSMQYVCCFFCEAWCEMSALYRLHALNWSDVWGMEVENTADKNWSRTCVIYLLAIALIHQQEDCQSVSTYWKAFWSG